MPRPKKDRRGEKPQWRQKAGVWVARVWEAGVCSGWTPLGSNRERADELYAHWLTTGEKPELHRGRELFEKAATRIIDAAEKDGSIEPDLAKDRRTRLRLYALPSLGRLQVGRIEPHHISSVLDRMATEHQKGAGSILKLRSDISQILGKLRREGAVSLNSARGMELPGTARVDTRERRSLTDEQLLEFQRQRGFTRPLDLMILFSRGIAGHRGSDVHAGVWQEVDLEGFAWMKVRRPKTDQDVGQAIRAGKRRVRAYEKVAHEIDEDYRPHLRAYWEAQGRPTSGPIFPLLRDGVAAPMRLRDGRVVERKASRAGGHKNRGTSYAKALRQAVWECGLYDPDPEQPWDAAHPNKAHCRFQSDTATTRRLHFHSFRGDLSTALMEAGTATATQLAITGHTQLSTQLKHYAGKRRVRVPKAALPGGAASGENQGLGQPAFTPEVLAALEVLQKLGRGALPSAAAPSAAAPSAAAPSVPAPPAPVAPIPAVPVREVCESLQAPESVEERGFLPRVGRKLRSGRSHRGAQVVDIAGVPESNRTTDPRFRNASEASPALVTPRNPVTSESASEPLTTGSIPRAGMIQNPRDELLAFAAKAVAVGDWALADQLRAVLDALPLASVHRLSLARKP